MLKAWVKIFLILILALILTVAFFRHTLCRFLISNVATRATGLKLSINELNLDILNNSLYLGGVTLFNPPEFKDKVLGKAKEIFIRYDLLGSLSGRLHLRLVKVQINEINIIRNEKGKSNVSAFRKKRPKTKPSPDVSSTSVAQKEVKESKTKKRPKFLIDRLELSLQKATFMDYRAEVGKPAVIIFTVKGPCVFKNVSDLGYIVNSVSAKGGFKYLLNNLLEIIPQNILKNTTEAIKKRIEDILPKVE